jgi:DNA repair exonuclease SbcCD ATPase subunit
MENTIEQTTVAPLVKYDVNEAALALTKERCATLSADTPKGYEEVRLALADLRNARVGVEKRRVELKADALAFGRLVDSEAKRYTALLIEIEEPLSQKKHDVDYEKARVKAEAEAVKIRALEAEIAANRARQEAELKAVRDAEEARLAVERAALDAERSKLAEERRVADEAARVEREAAEAKLATERAALAEERRKADEAAAVARKAEDTRLQVERERLKKIEDEQQAEREAIEADRRKVAAEREKVERAEFERLAKIKAEKDAVEKAERDRLEAAERQARLDALRPDLEKVRAFAASIRALVAPKPRSKEAKAMIFAAVRGLDTVAVELELAAEKAA